MSQPNPITPRPATEDDLAAVLRIERASHTSPWTEAQFVDELNNPQSNFIVLTDDETDEVVSGYIVYRDMLGETHILNVSVDPTQRRRGWARRLVSLAINDAYRRQHNRIFLEVRVSNAAARALYESLGFIEAGRRKAFYSNGEEAIFMELRVKGTALDHETEPGSNVYH